jgi:hypothetical protein
MTQFLKSTLFPDILTKKKKDSSHDLLEKIILLEARIILLEEENKKSAGVINELLNYAQTFSVLMQGITQDVVLLSTHVKGLLSRQSASYNDDIINKYLEVDDDDDGYLN